jgi:hypothetical protein
MKWGIRRYQNKDGSLTSAGRARYGSGKKVFVSGSSKTQDKNSGYYRKKLPDNIKSAIDSKMKNGDTILVGDAPGIDRQVQDYLKKNRYKHVTVYATGDSPRYSANKKWNTKLVDSKGYEPGTPEFNRQKDIAMTNDADEGIAVVLDKGGAKATRNNVDRLIEQNKDVQIFQITSGINTNKISYEYMKNPVSKSSNPFKENPNLEKAYDKMMTAQLKLQKSVMIPGKYNIAEPKQQYANAYKEYVNELSKGSSTISKLSNTLSPLNKGLMDAYASIPIEKLFK